MARADIYAFLRVLVLISALLWPSEALRTPMKDRSDQEPIPNVYHIFNAIHSSMRQWGSSLNHNGVSFFLATVPEGVLLHHGTYRDDRVEGMEWLAFEPEHAMNFAWRPVPCTNDSFDLTEADIGSHARSAEGWMRILHQHDAIDQKAENVQQVVLEDNESKPPRRRPPFCLRPGYLHTYATKMPLHLLYVDGQSAAKTTKGTLDAEDYILRYNESKRTPPSQEYAFDDYQRALDLCQLAKNDYGGKIDGVLRMEHGFEIILCDFLLLDVISILNAQNENLQNKFDPDDPMIGEFMFTFLSAVAARYDGIGQERVYLNYEDFVTSFAYADMDLWIDGDELPRLNSTSEEVRRKVKEDVRRMVVESIFPGFRHPKSSPIPNQYPLERCSRGDLKGISRDSGNNVEDHETTSDIGESATEGRHKRKKPSWKQKIERDFAKHRHPHHRSRDVVNWQAVTDLYITRYVKHLPYLTSGKFNTSEVLSDEINRIYKPYMNRTHHIRENEIERCTTAHIPRHVFGECEEKQGIAQRVITYVAKDICTTLWDAMQPVRDVDFGTSFKGNMSYHEKIAAIEDLMKRLAWTEWKKCSPGCGLDEVCYTAIWPFGSQKDHDQPSCKNGRAIMSEDSMGYWEGIAAGQQRGMT